jgi:hypothetical protein
MNCGEAEPLLSELLDGELSEETRAAIEAHIAGCERCAADYRALRRTVRFVRGRGAIDIAPGTPGGTYMEFNRIIADPASTTDPISVIWKALAYDPRGDVKGDER